MKNIARISLISSCLLFSLAAGSCVENIDTGRYLSSFEVTLLSPVGTPDYRCPLPGTPTAAFNLTGCPRYEYDSSERTVARLGFSARAIDNYGNLFDEYSNIASIEVVPGKVEAAFSQVRFTNGIVQNATVSFRGSFGDTMLRIIDDLPPSRSTQIAGMGLRCGYDNAQACQSSGLSCVNTKAEVGHDTFGLAYCTMACSIDEDCPSGYFCGDEFAVYGNSNFGDGACMRKQPTYASGVAGPMHMVKPTLADVSRSDSLISSPFQDEFIEVRKGEMIVTAIRIDGFYITDLCPLDVANGGPTDDNPRCSPEARAQVPEFNHLFIFSFSRPDDLYAGDRILSVAGPMTEFVGLTEMGFPLWQVDQSHRSITSPTGQKLPPKTLIPPAVDLHERLDAHYPALLAQGERCYDPNNDDEDISLLDCPFAMERLEGARISIKVKSTIGIEPDTPQAETLAQYGQWPVIAETKIDDEMELFIVTRENLPFFDPLPLGDRVIEQTITGNLRQVAFDDRQDPIWIIEPRDSSDCTWCQN